jgi:hypothetical protein
MVVDQVGQARECSARGGAPNRVVEPTDRILPHSRSGNTANLTIRGNFPKIFFPSRQHPRRPPPRENHGVIRTQRPVMPTFPSANARNTRG